MTADADQEHFGEASLGEAQSSDPPPDPEMLIDDDGKGGVGGEAQRPDAPADDEGEGEPAPKDL